jgi:hypothetical protein
MNMQKSVPILLSAAVAALVFAGCSSSGSSPTSPSRVCNLGANSLQLNVGTANLFGDTPAAAVAGTNVAVTYRQSASANCFAGNSGTLVNSPTLTRPAAIALAAGTADTFGSTILTGPAAGEVGTTSMMSLSQVPNVSGSATFGNDGGAFGLGLEPFNYVAPLGAAGVGGTPASVTPYPVPLYDALAGAGDPNAFLPGGGPPAFNIAGNAAAVQAGFNAISEGLDVFALAPVVGTYTLAVSVPANTGTVNQSTTAALTSAALLPAFTPPVPVLTGGSATTASGATIPVVLPAGVTEAYIQIEDFGPTATGGVSCVGATAGAPLYYTIEVTASGAATLPAGSLCSAAANATSSGAASDGDAFTVQAIGFDYPAYEASYPNSLGKPSPTLTGSGASHQADVTISSQVVYNNAAGLAVTPGGTLPSGRKRVGAIKRG